MEIGDIFEVVKAAVWDNHRASCGGLMLGIANLGNHPQGFLGAFYPVGTNVIVMNKRNSLFFSRISTKPLRYPTACTDIQYVDFNFCGRYDRIQPDAAFLHG